MKLKEKEIEEQILSWLNLQPGVFAFKVATGGWFDTKRGVFRKNSSKFLLKGTSDIIGMIHGKFMAIEVKSETGMKRFLRYPGKHELDQILFLRRVTDRGGLAICVCSLEEVMTALRQV